MELVVVNGANNISKAVIRNLTKQGGYNKVRLLDFRPYRQSVYSLQRELAADNVELQKKQTTSVQTLDAALEGSQHLVYFTHDYTSMTGCKNNFLQVTSSLAKKHGVQSMVAVCPVEHDFAYTEGEKTFIEERNEAEQKALQANGKLTLLRPNLVFGDHATYMVHYMTQCAMTGKAPAAMVNKQASFQYKPVHHDDLARAIQTSLNNGLNGKSLAVSGSESMTISELMAYLEGAAGREVGSTSAKRELPLIELAAYVEEFFTGITHDRNMANLLQHYEQNPDTFAQEACFWEASGTEAEQKVSQFYKYFRCVDEHFAEPTFGAYKCASLD